MGPVTKWVIGVIAFIVFFYGIIIAINEIKRQQNKPKTFPCTYIKGKCTLKPTYENCKKVGSVPHDYCEAVLNGRIE